MLNLCKAYVGNREFVFTKPFIFLSAYVEDRSEGISEACVSLLPQLVNLQDYLYYNSCLDGKYAEVLKLVQKKEMSIYLFLIAPRITDPIAFARQIKGAHLLKLLMLTENSAMIKKVNQIMTISYSDNLIEELLLIQSPIS